MKFWEKEALVKATLEMNHKSLKSHQYSMAGYKDRLIKKCLKNLSS